jgi:hypothetical protein
MTPQEVLAFPPRLLSQAQRKHFFKQGYVQVEDAIPSEWLARLRQRLALLIEQSRSVSVSNLTYILAPGHSAANPRLRRIEPLAQNDPLIWSYLTELEADIASDLLGPDVGYWATNINTKWSGGGEPISWHQDIAFDPHTNFGYLQLLGYLDDVGLEQGPLMVVPGSHRGPIFEHYDSDDRWTGSLAEWDMEVAGVSQAVSLPGKAGSLIAIHCRTVHGSQPNNSGRMRPVLINAYHAADSFPYGPQITMGGGKNKRSGEIIRGRPAIYAHHQAVRWRMPPDFSGGYTSIHEYQQKEIRTANTAM